MDENEFKKKYGDDQTLSFFYGHLSSKFVDVTNQVVDLFFKKDGVEIPKSVNFNVVFGDPCFGISKFFVIRDGFRLYLFMEGRHENIKIKTHHAPSGKRKLKGEYGFINYQRSQAPINLIYLDRMKGLNVTGDDSQPLRINILLQGLSKSLTGGPLSIFQVAQQWLDQGGSRIHIRIINCCNTPCKSTDVIQLLPHYNLPHFNVEWVDFNNLNNLRCNPHDLFMGTLYSTAVVAHYTQRKLNNKPFIYMIQDYEPYFFEHGSDAIEAYYTYDLPHLAIYNSWFLEKYFQTMKVGNYSANFKGIRKSMMYFPPYTANFNLGLMKQKRKKRLLVYSREHAQRNAYTFTMSCLWKAVERGLFKDWDIFGVGGHDGMPHITDLGHKKVTLFNINHMNFDEYIKFIQSGDVGLSIMTTPHPSLPPFDFASCGMLVVTNTLHTREVSDYTKISHNFFVGKTNVDDIVEQLRLAMDRADDIPFRIAGSSFNQIPASSVDYETIEKLLHS